MSQIHKLLCVLVVALLWSAITPHAASARQGGRERSRSLEDYLLRQDFVVLGSLEEQPDAKTGLLRISIREVLLGALPSGRVAIQTVLSRPLVGAGTEVLAWGTWVGAQGDTCFGNFLVRGSDGSLAHQDRRKPLEVEGAPATQQGSLQLLRARLRLREMEHPVAWLASGKAVALTRIEAINAARGEMRVAQLRFLAGSAGRTPTYVTWNTSTPCRFAAAVGDSVIIPIPPSDPDTLNASACLDRLHIKPQLRNALGVALTDIRDLFTLTGQHLALRKIHGAKPDAIRNR